MIQANELRIGNRLLNCDNEIVIVKELRDEFYLNESGQGQYYKTSNGIPLTPKILEKCGFVKLWHLSDYEYTLLIDNDLSIEGIRRSDKSILVRVVTSNENFDENINVGSFTTYRDTNVQYLHQLQNIHFALTWEELEINL